MIEHLRLKLKKSSKRFHLFQFLSAKHTKTGRFGRKTAAFQALLAKERAKPDHSDYDPATDEDPKSTINQLIQSTSLAMEGVGHSFVRMIAYGKGRRLSRYSFGFWPLAKAVMGGATEGEVRNPDTDKDHTNVITKNYPLRYSDYLRAAARIRGIVGTPRSYSFTDS